MTPDTVSCMIDHRVAPRDKYVSAVLAPRISSLSEGAYEAIAAAIYSGAFAPGTRLVIDALAPALQMSISPVREALTRLANQGIVTFLPNRGYVVTPLLTRLEFDQLFAARLAIESGAFAGTPRSPWDPSIVERIADRAEEMRTSPQGSDYGSYGTFAHADNAFHTAVLQLTENPFLVRAWQSLNLHMHVGRLYDSRGVIDHTVATAEHDAILAAVLNGNVEGLRSAMTTHVANAALRLRELVPTVAM